MAGKGGARPGAGRKPNAVKYERPINRAEKQIIDRLPQIIAAQLALALGGIATVREEYALAGTLTTPSGDGLTLVFPDKRADELIVVKRINETTLPDRAAGQYLIDRILGKATTRIEASGENGGPLVIRVEYDNENSEIPATASGSTNG